MPSPLDIIQTLSQKVMSGKKAGAETNALTGESSKQAEAFSSAFNQALQPRPQQQSLQPGKAETTLNAIAAEAEQPGDDLTAQKAEEPSPAALSIDLLALQPIQIFIEPAPSVTESTPAVSRPSLEEAALNLPASNLIQPEAQSSQAQPKTLAIPTEVADDFDQINDTMAETTGKPAQKDLKQDTIMLAQAAGLSPLSPEAILMMAIPVELQIQNTIPAVQTQQTPASPGFGEATQPLPQAEPLESLMPLYSPARLKLDTSLPSPAQANWLTANMDQSLEQATPEQEILDPAAANMKLESALAIEETMAQTEISAMPPIQDLPNGPDSLQFNQVLTESGAKMLDSENKNTTEPTLKALETATSLPIQNERKTNAQTALKPTPARQSVEALLNPFTEIQQTLEALNGKIESIAENPLPANTLEKSALPEEAPSETTTPAPAMPGDIQAPIALNDKPPSVIPGKVPQFISSAADPADQVVDGTLYSLKNGYKELILKINPDNLGEVRINLTSMGESGLSARLIASNPESHALLKTQADALKASLEAQGVHVERLSVVLAGQTETSNNAGKQEQPQSQYPQQQQSSSASQQQTFQQPEQNLNAFFQSGGGPFPNKQGFAQNPGSGGYEQTDTGNDKTSSTSDKPIRRNDNGNVSVLA
jgi:hypothetical protein